VRRVGAGNSTSRGGAVGAGIGWVAVAERVGSCTVEGKVANWVGRSSVTTGISSREARVTASRYHQKIVAWVGWVAERQHRSAWRR